MTAVTPEAAAPAARDELAEPPPRRGAAPKRVDVTLGGQFKANGGFYLVGGLLLAVQQTLMAGRDFLVRGAVDSADAGQASAAARAATFMLVVSVGAAVVRVLSRTTVFSAGRNVEYVLRRELLGRLHKLGPAFFRQMPTGDIMSRATNDLGQVRLLLGFGVLNVMGSTLALASALFVMLRVSGKLTLAALAIVPPLVLITRAFSSRMFGRSRENQESIGKMGDRVLASLAGVRVVRSFALETTEVAAFKKLSDDYLKKSLALASLRGAMGPIFGSMGAVGMLIVFWYGGYLVVSGAMTKGAFVSFWLAFSRLVWPMLALGFVASIVQRGRAGYARLSGIFDAVPEVQSGALPAPSKVGGALAARGLSFAHGSRKVLDDVSFDVPAGGSLAVVGRTGSGKSTLAVLLARLLPTPKGSVFLDGADVCDLPLETVRESIGYAQQDAFLFSTTVAANVGYALDEVDSDEAHALVRAAAAEASVLAEVEQLPEAFDTVVGERGVQLSGGQRQRVALARALIREPQVLVLDDPLSAVDARTESTILGAIERQAAKRTLVLITHRVAAARRCKQIIVLDAGRVIEGGSHDELVALGGLYAKFAEEQRLEADLDAFVASALPVGAPAPSVTSAMPSASGAAS